MNERNNILVIDDNKQNLKVVSNTLKDAGYQIALSTSGMNALHVLQDNRIDLILLDIMMPDMDGLDVCRTLKADERYTEIPVIFLTAKNQSEDLVEGFRAGGVDYITKPFNKDELLIRVKNHLELFTAKKKLQEMNRTRDKLYSIIAHDIRSPFNNISMVVSSLADGTIDPSGNTFRELIQHLQQSTEDTSTLLNNLLEWTRMQTDTITMKPENLSVNALITENIFLQSGNAKRKNIKIFQNGEENVRVFADEWSLKTVFRNLLSNAVKFTPEKGSISISSEYEEDYVVVHVEDTGVGMGEEVINKIFHKKEHYSTRGTNHENGSGLGLHMVKEFIERNHGKIIVVSTPGEGTKFSVYIPMSKEYAF